MNVIFVYPYCFLNDLWKHIVIVILGKLSLNTAFEYIFFFEIGLILFSPIKHVNDIVNLRQGLKKHFHNVHEIICFFGCVIK